MKPGQKVNLLRKLALGLGELGSCEDGDFILRHFGFPTSDKWNGDIYFYYVSMLEQGEEPQWVELHEYIFPGDPLPNTTKSVNHGRWEEGSFRLFLSHSSTKKLLVTQIKQELADFGVQTFVAHEDIEPASDWLNEIKRALNTCHAFAALLCEEFPTSKYCDQEVGQAMQRGVFVIPVRLEIDPYGFMAPLQGVHAFEKSPAEIAQDVFALISKHSSTSKIASKAHLFRLAQLTNEFLNSSNFTTSTTVLKKLESFDSIPKALLQKINENWTKNDQIYKCAKIPQRMEWLFKKHRFEAKNDIPLLA